MTKEHVIRLLDIVSKNLRMLFNMANWIMALGFQIQDITKSLKRMKK